MLWTTLRVLWEQSACEEGYKKLRKSLPERFGQDEAIPLLHILFSNGLDDTLWALSAVHPDCEAERDTVSRLMAADFADEVRPIYEADNPGNSVLRETIETVRRFARGAATEKELVTAWDVAWDAARDSRAAMSRAASAASRAAVAAARASSASSATVWAAWEASDAARATSDATWEAMIANVDAAKATQEKIVFEYLSGKRK